MYIMYNASILIQNVRTGDIKQPLCDMTLDLTQSTNHIIMEHILLSLGDFEEVRISFIISTVSWNYFAPFYDWGPLHISRYAPIETISTTSFNFTIWRKIQLRFLSCTYGSLYFRIKRDFNNNLHERKYEVIYLPLARILGSS